MKQEALKNIKTVYGIYDHFVTLLSKNEKLELMYQRDIATIAIELTKIYEENYFFITEEEE